MWNVRTAGKCVRDCVGVRILEMIVLDYNPAQRGRRIVIRLKR